MTKRFFISLFFLAAVSPLFASSAQGTLSLRVEPAYFSPNNDGVQDQTFVYPVLSSNMRMARWTLDIVEAKRRKRVARLSGPSFPGLIKWDGVDKKGMIVGDGTYVAQMTAIGQTGKFRAEQSFAADTQAPSVQLSLSTSVFDQSALNGGKIVFAPRIVDDSPIDRWLTQVINTSGRTVFLYWSTGPVSPVDWDGRDPSTHVLVPEGKYQVACQAWDKAGNESAPVFRDLAVNITARQMLEQAIHYIQINETPEGLLVPLETTRAFQRRKGGKWEISDYGRSMLGEVAVLINAYQEAPVRLEGYARLSKKSTKDRDQASVLAWKVYSFLIKEGHVKPSRLAVRGRGRSAMFDRRSLGVPVLQNGVEVTLEGRGPW